MHIPGFIPYQPMLLDRCIIRTDFLITPYAVTDRLGFNAKNGTDILEIEPGSRQINGEDLQTVKLVFGSYGGIVVFAELDPFGHWFANQIHFNPRNTQFRHNGNSLSVDEFLNALTILRDQVYHLLENGDDIIHIVPWLHSDSREYWSLLEIPIDLANPDGSLEKQVFRNPHFPKMSEGFRARKGMTRIGDGPFQIKFYHKDRQMKKVLRNFGVKDVPRVFRIELVLSQHKLLEHLGNGENTQEINGYSRLCRFTPADLFNCHRRVMARLEGCFNVSADPAHAPSTDKLGRFMALIASHRGIPLVELFHLYETNIGCAQRTQGRHRKAAREMLANISPATLDELFSHRNYKRQPAIVIAELEKTVEHRRQYGNSDLDI